jgi:hypothetical protein
MDIFYGISVIKMTKASAIARPPPRSNKSFSDVLLILGSEFRSIRI